MVYSGDGSGRLFSIHDERNSWWISRDAVDLWGDFGDADRDSHSADSPLQQADQDIHYGSIGGADVLWGDILLALPGLIGLLLDVPLHVLHIRHVVVRRRWSGGRKTGSVLESLASGNGSPRHLH